MKRDNWQVTRARNYDPARGHFNVTKGLGTKWANRRPGR